MFEVLVQRSVFVKALSHVQSIVDRKNIAGISSHLKLEALGNRLTITATDNSLSITEVITAQVMQSGAITVAAHTLYEIIRKFSDETVQLKIDPTQATMVEISAGYSVFHLPFLNAEEFPQTDVGEFDCKFTLPYLSMQKIIEKNRNTISQEDSRYHLNGIYLHSVLEENELRATATDGHRLSSVRLSLPTKAKNMPAIIIPRKTIFELSKILSDNQQDLTIEVSPVKIRFSIGDVVIISKLIDGQFPDYLALIPYNNSLYFNLSSIDLARAVDRASTIMMEKSQAIKFNINGNQLEIQAGGDHQSLANEKLEVTCNVEQFDIAFNAKYLLDIMAAISNGADVEFKLSDPYSAVLVQSKEDDQTDFVIMPMRA